MRELELLLDMEFKDQRPEKEEYVAYLKDKAIIYFALKHYLGYIATHNGSMDRIKTTIDLALEYKELAKEYCENIINREQGNLSQTFDIKELDEDDLTIKELKSKLEN